MASSKRAAWMLPPPSPSSWQPLLPHRLRLRLPSSAHYLVTWICTPPSALLGMGILQKPTLLACRRRCAPTSLPSSSSATFMVWTAGSMTCTPTRSPGLGCLLRRRLPSTAKRSVSTASPLGRRSSASPYSLPASLTRSAPPATPTAPWRNPLSLYPPSTPSSLCRHSGAARISVLFSCLCSRRWPVSAVVCSCQVPHPSRLCLMGWVDVSRHPPLACFFRREQGDSSLNKAN